MTKRHYFHFGCQQTKYKKVNFIAIRISVDFPSSILTFSSLSYFFISCNFLCFICVLFDFFYNSAMAIEGAATTRTSFKKFAREPNTNVTLLINIGCAHILDFPIAPAPSSSPSPVPSPITHPPQHIRPHPLDNSAQRTNITQRVRDPGAWKPVFRGRMQTSEGCQNLKLLGNM